MDIARYLRDAYLDGNDDGSKGSFCDVSDVSRKVKSVRWRFELEYREPLDAKAIN